MFLEKVTQSITEKKSRLCVGLDPVSIFMRDHDSVPPEYFGTSSESQALARFCSDVIDECAPFASAFKLNSQFAFGMGIKEMEGIAKAAHENGAVCILDHKLGDIGASNEAFCYWAHKAQFDAITFSPFAGNIEQTANLARAKELGSIVLTLMSNPEAGLFMRSQMNGMEAYKAIALLAKDSTDGFVIGANNTVEMSEVRELVGSEKLMLIPGIGRQGGDPKAAAKSAGKLALFNVGRDILYAEDRDRKARQFRDAVGMGTE